MEQVMTAIRVVPLEHYLVLSFLLFSIGMAGALVRRNTIIVI
jgi:NADH:ubiquinone oxidoreductase subunit K